MGRVISDRVKETSAVTGTGSATLTGALTGHVPFSDWCADGDEVNYAIVAVDSDGNPSGQWETGKGTWTAGVLARTTPYQGSAATPVNFSAGTKHVSLVVSAYWLETALTTLYSWAETTSALTATKDHDKGLIHFTYAAGGKTFTVPTQASADFYYGTTIYLFNRAAGDLTVSPSGGVTVTGNSMVIPPYSAAILQRITDDSWNLIRIIEPRQRGAIVKKSSTQTSANYSTATAVAWDAEISDTDTIHDNSTNNMRLTVPAGVTRARLKAQIELANNTADNWVKLVIKKNGAAFDGMAQQSVEIGDTAPVLNCGTAELVVTSGDYFEAFLQCEDTSVDVVHTGSWFAMEIVL